MNLYIKIENNQPLDHPIMENNLLQVFPDTDINNLPPYIVRFNKTPKPELGPYDKNCYSVYQYQNESVTESWIIEPMTESERLEKINIGLQAPHHASWIFNEDLCQWDPPIPKPTDNKDYYWDDTIQNWIEINE